MHTFAYLSANPDTRIVRTRTINERDDDADDDDDAMVMMMTTMPVLMMVFNILYATGFATRENQECVRLPKAGEFRAMTCNR